MFWKMEWNGVRNVKKYENCRGRKEIILEQQHGPIRWRWTMTQDWEIQLQRLASRRFGDPSCLFVSVKWRATNHRVTVMGHVRRISVRHSSIYQGHSSYTDDQKCFILRAFSWDMPTAQINKSTRYAQWIEFKENTEWF